MQTPAFDSASFQIGLALVLGMVCQVLARRLRVPGIVVLLAVGLLAGPEVGGLLDPSALGHGLADLVGFAVAIILFEGGLALDFASLRRHGLAIRRLVTTGVAVTAVLATLAVRVLLDWEWTVAALFGTLVVVTGPTVVQPLLRRIRVKPNVATVLEAEGILGDAIGATLAVVALEVVLAPGGETVSHGIVGLLGRLGVGCLFGLATAGAIALVLRFERLVPHDLRNVTALAILLGFYQASNAFQSESGVLVAVVAGLGVANLPGHPLRRLREFKEELTVLLLGLLFILLAADVRLDDLRSLGLPGVAVVVFLMLVARPVNVWLSTRGTDLEPAEKAFLAWLAPRGIVAAAVASHFATVLGRAGLEGGRELQALVFLLIAVTVTVHGLSGGWVARRLGVALPEPTGWAILGANPLGRLLGERLGGPAEVAFLDSNHVTCREAAKAGYRVWSGNVLEARVEEAAGLDRSRRFVAVTSNEEVNFLFAQIVRSAYARAPIWVALRRDHSAIGEAMLDEIRAHRLFDGERHLELWEVRIARRLTAITVWRPPDPGPVELPRDDEGQPASDLLPLVLRRDAEVLPFSDAWKPKPGDVVEFVFLRETQAASEASLERLGWAKV